MIKKKVIVSAVIVFLILIAGVYISNKLNQNTVLDESSTNNETYCNSDLDCVANSCCHPNACVNVNYKPECEGIICSQECAPGSLDCGQATCGCINNKCNMVIK